MGSVKALLLYAQSPQIQKFTYMIGWPKNFRRHPRFDCIPLNVLDRGRLARLRARYVLRRGRFDAVIVLHSVFSNSCYLNGWLFDAICAAPQPKAYFIGNEFKLMPEKMAFCDALNVSLLVTMIPSLKAQALYRERLGCEVVSIPSAGLDRKVFFPNRDRSDREIDIGFRSVVGPRHLGHDERQRIANYFLRHAPSCGLKLDISLKAEDRFDTAGWAAFLNRCKGQLGTEAGGDYFELTDATRNEVNKYLKTHPDAGADELFPRFFENHLDPVPNRMITGRQVEGAGTKTVQILFDGYYSGYLRPDVHYIPLRKDLSNFDEAIAKFRDEGYCREITENAYGVAVNELSHGHLIDRFFDAFARVI